MKRYFLLCLFVLGLVYVKGQDGTLDSAFAGKGYTNLHFFDKGNYNYEYPTKLLVRENKYIAAFEMNYGTMLARYLPDGTVDTLFGDKGFSPLVFMESYNAAAQNDGKIVVVGNYTYSDSIDHSLFAIVRFNENGSVDSSFGTDGIKYIELGQYATATALAILNDGKILVGGESYTDSTYDDFAIVRLNTNGSLDSSFGNNGRQFTDFNHTYQYLKAIKLLSDGGIMVAGTIYYYNTTFDYYFGLVRYNSDGSLDSSFGNQGFVTSHYTYDDQVSDMLIQSDGKILVGGTGNTDPGFYDWEMVRYDSTGAIDSSFGNAGAVITDLSEYDYGQTLALQEDGKILFGGRTYISDSVSATSFTILRYDTSGILDSSFGNNGHISKNFGAYSYVESLVILPDQNILALGGLSRNPTDDILLARFDNTGEPDSSFNETGIFISYFPSYPYCYLQSIAVQNDGKIVVGGGAVIPEKQNDGFALARYNSNGTLDADFGNGGLVITDFGNWGNSNSIAIQSDGKILLAGTAADSNYNDNFALARYNSNGSLDSSFGIDGKVMTYIENNDAYLRDMKIQNDGKIVVAGGLESNEDYSYNIGLARYNPDGTLDSTGFGTSGKVITDLGMDENLSRIVIQNDGKIIGVGSSYLENVSGDFLLIRYNTNGSIDSSFSDDGIVSTDFGGDDDPFDIKMVGGGFLVAGSRFDTVEFRADVALASYDSTGTLNTNFGTGGKVITDFSGFDLGYSLALQTDGKFLIAGESEATDYSTVNPLLARYDSTGNLDPVFGTGGILTTGLDYPSYFRSSYWNAGRLYVAGSSYLQFSEAGLVASYKATTEVAGLPVISINDVTVYENAGTANLTISLNKSSHPPITINYQTKDGTALSRGKNPDYKATKGTVTIPDGSQSAQISITIKTDNVNDSTEYFYVNLSLSRKMSGKAVFGDSSGVVTILNGAGLLDELTKVSGKEIQDADNVQLSAKALPNPSSSYFNLRVESKNKLPMTVNVLDASGRLVETKTGIAPNSSLLLGGNYRPGIYYAQVIQGNGKQTLKLIKE